MKNTVFAVITQAIDERRLLLITDETGPRLIEPYLLFESLEGDMLLHGWQQAGAFRVLPPPHWCDIHVGDIRNIEMLSEHFPGPHRDYSPEQAKFHRVLYAIEPDAAVPDPRRGLRLQGERRRPPPGSSDVRNRMRFRRRFW